MIALLGSILGIFGSLIPNILKLWQDKSDKKHEIVILNIQIERERLGHIQRLEEISTQADIEETQALYKSMKPVGVKWVDALTASVRPILTYAFFALYAYVKIPLIMKGAHGDVYSPFYTVIWSEMDVAIFCTVITFWFGNRTFQKIFIKK